jgi:hypothetical protein
MSLDTLSAFDLAAEIQRGDNGVTEDIIETVRARMPQPLGDDLRLYLREIGREARSRRANPRRRLSFYVCMSGFVCVNPDQRGSCGRTHGTVDGAVLCRMRDELAGIDPGFLIHRGFTHHDWFSGRKTNTLWMPHERDKELGDLMAAVLRSRASLERYRGDDAQDFAEYIEKVYQAFATEPQFGPYVHRTITDADTLERISVRMWHRGVEIDCSHEIDDEAALARIAAKKPAQEPAPAQRRPVRRAPRGRARKVA